MFDVPPSFMSWTQTVCPCVGWWWFELLCSYGISFHWLCCTFDLWTQPKVFWLFSVPPKQEVVEQCCTIKNNSFSGKVCSLCELEGEVTLIWRQQCTHSGQRRQNVWRRSEGSHTGRTITKPRWWIMTLLISHLQHSVDIPCQAV